MSSDQVSMTLLTQYFYPDVPGTAQISTDLAIGLAESGFRVRVFTGQPAYTGTQSVPAHEVYRGVHIYRAYSRALSRRGILRRLFNSATVAAGTMIKVLRQEKPDVIMVDSTSPVLLVVAWIVYKLRRVPYVFQVQDVYPDIAIRLGVVRHGSLRARIWRATYRRIYGAASRIVVLGPRMKDVVVGHAPRRTADKCVVIPNWADGTVIVPRAAEENHLRKELGLSDKLVVIYSGNMGLTHDMETVLGAADRLRHVKDLRFLLIGGGGLKEAVADMVRYKGLDNVTMLPYQPAEMLPYSLTCGDMSLVTLRPGFEGLSVPSKVYSSLAAGLAVLAVMGPTSEVADLVEEHRCGYRVGQGDSESLAKAIETLYYDRGLLSEMGRRARACFDANYTRVQSIGSYASMLRAVATGSAV